MVRQDGGDRSCVIGRLAMHARLITSQAPLDRLDQGIQGWSAGQMDTLAQRGFRGNMMLVDRETGKVVVVSLWETEEDAHESGNTLQSAWVQFQQAGLLVGQTTIEYFEVSARNEAPR